ncbi:hypothetical protein Bca52824_024507 [Brassica carinata]|uniref:GRF-type domain-containing protein n=1 Tax=Brassica carinata TaxID=52824 RepID=A0A8X7VKB6_BRACI|nr:hypothetical protein Bca52824_024507 [Brassica carinata]
MLLIGETFKVEDFPGGERLFKPRLEIRDDGPLPKDEKYCPSLVHQRNLRPRKPVPVDIEEISSSGDSKAADPPCPGRCTQEDLKRWMLVQFEKMENQFDELRTIICRSLDPGGKPEGKKIKKGTTRKKLGSAERETGDQNECDNGLTTRPFQKTSAQIPSTLDFEGGSPVAWEKTNRHRYRSVGSVCSFNPSWNGTPPPSKAKETSQSNGGEVAQQQEKESVTTRTPPPDSSAPNSGKAGQRPEDESVNDRTTTTVENPTAQQQEEECGNGGTAPPVEKVAAQETGTEEYGQHNQDALEHFSEQVRTEKELTQSVGHDSVQTSNLEVPKSAEKVEKVHFPIVDVSGHAPPIAEEINSEFAAMEEEERYDSCRDDMSTDTQIQENRVLIGFISFEKGERKREREMDFRGRGSYKGKGKRKETESNVLCHCGVPVKNAKAWTDKNPGRRFYGCERWKTPLDCEFFQWIDEGEPFGWQKQALIEARNEIWQKDKTIMELKKIISKLQSDWVKNAEFEEDIINGFLKL